MTVNRDTFVIRDFNHDFQPARTTNVTWAESERAAYDLVPTHCSFCGVQCGMNLRVSEGRVVGVEPRDFPHNRGALCPKGIVAYQQADHPDRIVHPLIRRGGKGGTLEPAGWDEALDYIAERMAKTVSPCTAAPR
jgi:assimilatory nitrate reductase catalytic subunit